MNDDARLDAIQAWTVRAQAVLDGIKAELRANGRSRQLRERMNTLKAELETQTRTLDEIREDPE